MAKLEIKRDPWVIGASTLIALGLLVLLGMRVLTWKEALAGLGLLFAPSLMGRRDDAPAGAAHGTEPPPLATAIDVVEEEPK